ncbi:MAG: hypothetical protein H6702_16175 [Myxococcales bacterium]|nr:hypothetical protein [Myxococcales bacterium]
MLRALRAGRPVSRNRHYDLYRRPEVRRARDLHRFLASVAADVQAHPEQVEVTPAALDEAGASGRYALRIDFPRLNGRRTAYLTAFELELLAEQAPEVAELLAARVAARSA